MKQYFCIIFTSTKIIRLGNFKKIDVKVAVNMPNNIVGTCTLLPSLEREGLHIQNKKYNSIENNVLNIAQPENLPMNIKLELLNRNTNNTTFRIRKKKWIFCDDKWRGGTHSTEIQRGNKKWQLIIKYITMKIS